MSILKGLKFLEKKRKKLYYLIITRLYIYCLRKETWRFIKKIILMRIFIVSMTSLHSIDKNIVQEIDFDKIFLFIVSRNKTQFLQGQQIIKGGVGLELGPSWGSVL